jgi:hypothetical protein
LRFVPIEEALRSPVPQVRAMVAMATQRSHASSTPAVQESDVQVHFSGIVDRVERFTAEQRANLFYSLEGRWCWDCGFPQGDPAHDECPSSQTQDDALSKIHVYAGYCADQSNDNNAVDRFGRLAEMAKNAIARKPAAFEATGQQMHACAKCDERVRKGMGSREALLLCLEERKAGGQ